MKRMFIFLLLLAGCSGKQAPSDRAQEQKAKTEKSYIGRFQPFKNLPGIALDTMSGKLCKTFDPKGTDNKDNAIPSQYMSQPLCSSLSNCD